MEEKVKNDEYKIGSFKVKNVADLIKSFRHKNELTQKELAIKIGSFVTEYYDTTTITKYETGKTLPGINHIYRMASVFNIDKDAFFNAVLREHYDRFIDVHHKSYFDYVNKLRKGINPFKDGIAKEGRYFFCTEGKIAYRFTEFSSIMKKCYRDSGKTFKQIRDEMEEHQDINRSYSQDYIRTSITGKEAPSMKIVIDLSAYFGLNPFKMYSLMVKEKAFAHAANMMKQWEMKKRDLEKEQKIAI